MNSFTITLRISAPFDRSILLPVQTGLRYTTNRSCCTGEWRPPAPLLFGGGCRLFEVLPSRVELEIVRVIDTPEATHIHYRVRR